MNVPVINLVGRCDGMVDALRAELGGVLAERVLEAEAADFLWDARVQQRYLGEHVGPFSEDTPFDCSLSRMAIVSVLERCWYAAMCLVDGDGSVTNLLWKQAFNSPEDARAAFENAR